MATNTGTNWRESSEFLRIMEILEDYWTTQADELRVRVTMDFVKANGETQQKQIIWRNPNYEYIGPPRKYFVSLADMNKEYFEQKEADFWNVRDYKKKMA